jgi:hypothetical protein
MFSTWLPMSPTQLDLLLQQRREPLLGVLRVDEPDWADVAARDHLPSVLHGGVPGVGVGDAEEQALLAGQHGQLLGLAHLEHQWLVADDVDPVRQEGLGRGEVRRVGRHDDGEVDAVPALRLCVRHLVERAVEAVRRHPERPAGRDRVLMGTGEAAGREDGAAVERDGLAVDVADERALAAADHPVPERCA